MKKGNLVLDPCAGSNTTAFCAEKQKGGGSYFETVKKNH